MIDAIELINFKCYKNQRFELSRLTVFCGNNSVGKSTAIQSLLLALQSGFSDKILYSGELISVGSYKDLHNKFSDNDSLLISFEISSQKVTWGYDFDNPENPHYDEDDYQKNMDAMDETPLPLVSDPTELRSVMNRMFSKNFQYLCAERWGPRNFYPYSKERRSKTWLGIHGEYIAQVLSENFSSSSKGIVLEEGDLRIHPNAQGRGVASSLYEWMSEISPGVFIESKVVKGADISPNLFQFNGENYRPINVGFGLSYSLPIVTALLMAPPGGLVIIENPEAHMHPRGQSYLGRLIALSAEAGIQILVETHSDHLLNGIRVISRLSEQYTKGMFKIFHISSGEEQSLVEDLPIGDKGELPNWPVGFFDQQALDIKSIIKGENVTQLPKKRL